MTTPTLSLADRDIRQRQIVPREKLAQCRCLVIGVGAIGRQVALQLAAMGVGMLELVDFDTVGVENLAVQGYFPSDIGRAKAAATAELCRQINPDLAVQINPERFRRFMARSLHSFQDPSSHAIVFACVDSITTRGILFEAVKDRASLFLDGRMNAEVMRILAIQRPATDTYYPTTLFSESESVTGPCTGRSTIFTASIAAGLLLSQFAKWLREMPLDRDITLNLLAGEWSVT